MFKQQQQQQQENHSFSKKDEQFMQEALKMAEMALRNGEVPVGCVIVHKDEKIIGRGANRTVETRNGTRHAEFEAFDQILSNPEYSSPDIFQECTLYVTVEPCIMCASALLLMKIKKVYCGCMNDKFGGCGSIHNVNKHQDKLNSFQNYECVSGLFAHKAIDVLKRFYNQENPLAPKPQRKKRKTNNTE